MNSFLKYAKFALFLGLFAMTASALVITPADPCPGGNRVCFGPNGEYEAKGAATESQ